MNVRDDYWTDLSVDERNAVLDGYGCVLCADFGSLQSIGPCPRRHPDHHAEHLIATAHAQLDTTRNEEQDDADGLGWEGAA